ncbi:MAG: hypothetical protein ABIG42_07630 [bacterium]
MAQNSGAHHGLIGGILTIIGFIILLVPGMIIGRAFYMCSFLIVDKKAKFGEALSAAFALISSQAVNLLVFYLFFVVIGIVLGIIGLIPILGLIVELVAALVLMPVFTIAIYKSYMEFFGTE